MYKASRAMAYLRGKNFVSPVDIAYIAKNIMHHRLVLSYEAEAEGKTADSIIANILQKVAIP